MKSVGKFGGVLFLTLLLVVLWQFPRFWYAGGNDISSYRWFAVKESISGWSYEAKPVGDAAEAILVADMMTNGAFRQGEGPVVRVFSAKRFEEKENAVGLFSHTPDRCWTNTGMVIEPSEPYFRRVSVHGIEMLLERRVFSFGQHRELAYFGALVGGEALPYRMDQYLKSGLGRNADVQGDVEGAMGRLYNSRVWSWALESFARRTRLAGPQQLIRLSTPIEESVDLADSRLMSILEQWLQLVPYEEELLEFKKTREVEG